MNDNHALAYGLLESATYLRIFFVGHIIFKKVMKIQKFIEICLCCLTRLTNKNKNKFLLIIFINKKHFEKGKYGIM